jgi:hypothetical protein
MAGREIGRDDEWRAVASVLSPMPSPAWFWSCDLLPAASLKQAPYFSGKRRPLLLSSDGLDGRWQPTRHETVWRAVASRKGGRNKGATWPQFLKSCRAQLASTTSAPPQGGFAPATPVPTPAGSLFPWQRLAAPPAGSAASTGGDLRRRRQLGIAVPDQRSFRSMSIRTFTIFPAGLTCARRRLRLQVIAHR